MPTRLVFTDSESVTVDQDLSEVESAFRRVSPNPAPLASFTKKEKKVFVNVARVRYFHEVERRSGRVVSW
jgi:hypothetical protein